MATGVVIVTYNRKDKLIKALKCFDEQTLLPDYMLIVNNASTDGTRELLSDWKKKESNYQKIVINMDSNAGGSGGFHRGLEEASKLSADWVWVSDDDAFPEKDALQLADNYIKENNGKNISAICGAVINNDKIDLAHRKKIVKSGSRIKFVACELSEYQKKSFRLQLFSYVGTIINVGKMKEVGTTNKEFFIWFDDSEHSLRLSKSGSIICIPEIRIHHDVGYQEQGVSWKSYYGIRNEIYTVRELFDTKTSFMYTCNSFLHSLKHFLLPKTHLRGKLELIGIQDGKKGKLGIHDVYKPGWRP